MLKTNHMGFCEVSANTDLRQGAFIKAERAKRARLSVAENGRPLDACGGLCWIRKNIFFFSALET